MKKVRSMALCLLPVLLSACAGGPGVEPRHQPAVAFALADASAPSTYRHDRFGTKPVDIERDFTAFVVSFDGNDDNVNLAVPEWVAYELRATPAGLGPAPGRPSTWATDAELFAAKIAPNDDSYKDSGYSRGHMCMKSHAHRISDIADRETHTVLNACPQLQSMNAGAWLSIENLTGSWADRFGAVWIIDGPVFFGNKEHRWVGDAGEVPVAVPDAFYKIVVKENGTAFDVLAFLVPMEGDEAISRSSGDPTPYLTSVDVIEALTGLDFLTGLPGSDDLEKRLFTRLWDVTAPVAEVAPAPSVAPSTPPRTAAVVAPLPQAAPLRQPPSPAEAVPTPASGPDVQLRAGATASAEQIALAKKLKATGWEYVMPRPKSAQARWGNPDGRTTWWPGYWKNGSGRFSTTQPSAADGWRGDGVERTAWRRGGSPPAPSVVEWLCSTDGGITPR